MTRPDPPMPRARYRSRTWLYPASPRGHSITRFGGAKTGSDAVVRKGSSDRVALSQVGSSGWGYQDARFFSSLIHRPMELAVMERHSGASRQLVSSSGEAGRRHYPRLLAAVVPRAGEDLSHRLVSNGPPGILALDRARRGSSRRCRRPGSQLLRASSPCVPSPGRARRRRSLTAVHSSPAPSQSARRALGRWESSAPEQGASARWRLPRSLSARVARARYRRSCLGTTLIPASRGPPRRR
jgi:hypothetical protein